MKTRSLLFLLPPIIAGIDLSAKASSQILVPEYISKTNTNGLFAGLPAFFEYLPQEVNLPIALFQETNVIFNTEIYESVRKSVKPPVVISFQLITFIFSSPSTNDPVYSFCEMDQPDELLCTGKSVSRRPGSTNEIPLIRVSTVDPHKKDVTADLDLLMAVAPVKDPQDVRYLRRSFHFVFRHGWRED